jgi:hypothetical protein
MNRFLKVALTASVVCACGRPDSLGLIYLDGRAVEPVGDSLLAMTTQGLGGIIVYDLRIDAADSLGLGVLHAPVQIEARRGRWYASDIVDGRPHVVVLSWDGALEAYHDLGDITATPHQFAVLPDDRIIVQSRDGRLLALDGDSVTTWALVEIGTRPSLLAGVAGGVLHTVPLEHITLYNEFGNIRWRIPWYWEDTAFFTDIGTDRQGRIHLIAGVPSDETFIVYTLGRNDGEVLQWSRPGPHATFTIRRNGIFRPDSAVNWIGGTE